MTVKEIRDYRDFGHIDKVVINCLWQVFLETERLNKQNIEFSDKLHKIESIIDKNYQRIKSNF